MHVFFSGIGGTGISSLALIAKEAGYEVSGSDARPSQYLDYLKKHGVNNTYVGLSREQIAAVHAKKPIDWYVYGSAQVMDFPDNPEMAFCQESGIKTTKRDEFLNEIITSKKLKMIAIAGTHGKTTTTSMAIWAFKQSGIPVSYSVGGKISFGDIGEYNQKSEHFVYEADEFDRNFLSFYPEVSMITGVDWDHPDIYPTRENYNQAFVEFIEQSNKVVAWQDDIEKLNLQPDSKFSVLARDDDRIDDKLTIPGKVNRFNAWQVIQGLAPLLNKSAEELTEIMNSFPGIARRFEMITKNVYTDYAHTPPKIRGALQLAHEVAGDNVVVIYEGLHNTRQHFIKEELRTLFEGVKKLYVVPTFLAREDKALKILSPSDLLNLLSISTKEHAASALLNKNLRTQISRHIKAGDLVLCLSAGSGGSLDEWLRKEFAS